VFNLNDSALMRPTKTKWTFILLILLLLLLLKGKYLYMDVDRENLSLIGPGDLTVLNVQPIRTIRVWGVGRDNGRYAASNSPVILIKYCKCFRMHCACAQFQILLIRIAFNS